MELDQDLTIVQMFNSLRKETGRRATLFEPSKDVGSAFDIVYRFRSGKYRL